MSKQSFRDLKNEIELNQIVYGDNITIEIPISFKRKNNFTSLH